MTVGEVTPSSVAPRRDWPAWQVSLGAVREWVALAAALDELDEAVPCRRDPEVWWARDSATQARAIAGCGGCPALAACRAYVLAAGERDGVWGGLAPADRGAAR